MWKSMSNSSDEKVTAMILARKASKGIVSKNLAKLNGISLIERSISILQESTCFSEIWVSTDDEDICTICEKVGVFVHRRASYTATDSAPSIWGVQEFIQKHSAIVNVCLVQCTSPFMKPKYLQEGLQRYLCGEFDSVFCVTRKMLLRWSEDLPTSPLNFDAKYRPQRQNFSGDLCETGMFYYVQRKLIEEGLLQGPRSCYVEIPEEDSLDINTPLDLFIAQQILNFRCLDT